MNYEQKYKEALKRTTNLAITNNISAIAAGEIFPELKESEDERIRKTLIEHIKGIKSWNYFLGISKEQMIAWLKKHKED